MPIILKNKDGVLLKTAGKYCPEDITVVPQLQEKTVTPSETQQTATPDANYAGLSKVTVEAIPDDYIIPSGTIQITENGIVDVSGKANANVNVPTGVDTNDATAVSGDILQGKTAYAKGVKLTGSVLTYDGAFVGNTHTITATLTNVTAASENATTIAVGETKVLTYTAADGYALPDTVMVSGATGVWNKDAGTLTLSNPTANVTFTIAGVEAAPTLQYYGTATALSEAKLNPAVTTVGNYALFGGGQDNSYQGYAWGIDAYDTSLTKSIPSELSKGRLGLAATNVGNYALFGGGYSFDPVATVDAYNTSLTSSIPTALSVARTELTAISIGNYALFGGGRTTGGSGASKATVDAYDTSLTRTVPTALSIARDNLATTNVGDYALFGGGAVSGSTSSISAVVDAYNASLTKTTPTALSVARNRLAATKVGNYALFGGGDTNGTVDAYNTSLTRSIPTALSVARHSLAATAVGNYALFGGGRTTGDSGASKATVDAYDTNLTRTIPTALSVARGWLSAITVGNYALFGGVVQLDIGQPRVM